MDNAVFFYSIPLDVGECVAPMSPDYIKLGQSLLPLEMTQSFLAVRTTSEQAPVNDSV